MAEYDILSQRLPINDDGVSAQNITGDQGDLNDLINNGNYN